MIAIKIKTDDIPGSEETNPSIVRRKRGANDSARRTRNILRARNTENPSEMGAKDIPIIKKSNKFHGSRKKRKPLAKALKPIQLRK